MRRSKMMTDFEFNLVLTQLKMKDFDSIITFMECLKNWYQDYSDT